MSIKDVDIRKWTVNSGENSPADTDRILRDFADQIRNIKSVCRSGSLDKGFEVYSYGSDGDYEVTASVDNQGSSLANLNIVELEAGQTTITLVGDKHLEFPNGQRVYGVSSTGSKSLMGEVFSCVVDTSNNFTVLTITWDKLGYATTFRYEENMSTASAGSQLGFDAAPANGISGKIKVKNDEKDNIKVKIRTFGFLDPVGDSNNTEFDAADKKNQVIHPFGTMDPTLVQAYTSGYFVSLQPESMSRDTKASGGAGAGAPNKGALTVTRVRKLPEYFEFCLLDSPGAAGSNKYVIYNWSITYAMRGV